jgi:hypothetical protein
MAPDALRARHTGSVACDGVPTTSDYTILDAAAERAPDAALIARVPAGVAWRLIVLDRSADIANGPEVPEAAFPATVLTTFDGSLTPTEPYTEHVGPVDEGATIEVAFGCSTGALTPTDPPTLVRVAVDGVTRELACLTSNVAHFIPASGRVEIGLATDRTVRLALEVRAFTPEQAGAVVAVPSVLLGQVAVRESSPGFTTCVKAYSIPGGASADEGCGPVPWEVPMARAVHVPAGDALQLASGGDWAITSAGAITYVPSSAAGNAIPGDPIAHPAPDGPDAGGGFTMKPLPVGDWTLRMDVSMRHADGTTLTAEQLFRVIVEP